MRKGLFIVLCLFTGSALAQVSIQDPWTRPTPPNAKLAAGYLTVVNAGAADRLVGASSPAAARVETHVTIKDGDIFRMRQVEHYDVPANGRLELRPVGAHLMLVGLKRPLREGEKVPLTLRFEKAGEVRTELVVGSSPATEKREHSGHQH